MSTDYTLNKVQLSNGNRINPNINDFIKYYDGLLKIDKEEQNDYGKSYGVLNEENGLYLWFFTDFDGYINSCCRYGSNWNETTSSLLISYIIDKFIDSDTLSFYSEKFDIDIRYWILLSEHQIDRFYDLCGKGNIELINLIYGDNYYETFKLTDFESYLENLEDEELKLTFLQLVDRYCKLEQITKNLLSEIGGNIGTKELTHLEMMEDSFKYYFTHTTT